MREVHKGSNIDSFHPIVIYRVYLKCLDKLQDWVSTAKLGTCSYQ